VLAPRHPERVPAALERAAALSLSTHRLSAGDDAAAGRPTSSSWTRWASCPGLYALAAASFVGGSLVPVGGHNLLEPVAAGSPVLFGPHVSHVAETAVALVAAGAGEQVADAEALAGPSSVSSPTPRSVRGASARGARGLRATAARCRARPT
jgi:3-deoxy-D-manno-octulosonic-acid transferase